MAPDVTATSNRLVLEHVGLQLILQRSAVGNLFHVCGLLTVNLCRPVEVWVHGTMRNSVPQNGIAITVNGVITKIVNPWMTRSVKTICCN